MMNKNSYVDHKKLKIDIVSPVSVGSGEKLTKKDYVFFANRNTSNNASKGGARNTGKSVAEEVIFLNALKFHDYIERRGYFETYESFHSDQSQGSLADWIGRNFNGAQLFAQQASLKSSVAKVHVDTRDNTLNDIHCHIKTVDGKAYIPGSSLKGMIRTAILYSLLVKSPNVTESYGNCIDKDKNSGANKFSTSFGKHITDFEGNLLQTLEIRDSNGALLTDKALLDAMRGISCSDAHLVKPIDTCIVRKYDYPTQKGGKGVSMPLCREALQPGTELSFTLSVDKRITASLGIISVEDVLEVVETYFKFVNKLARDKFGKQFEVLLNTTKGANCYLGSGVGLLAKSTVYAADFTKAVAWMQHMLKLQFPKGGHLHHGRAISPHTLKGTMYNKKACLMGLARISIDE